jgi:hypothetical protein
MIRNSNRFVIIGALTLVLEGAWAQEFEKLGTALAKALNSKTVFQTTQGPKAYYTKDATGKAMRVAFIQKRVYQPNCTHTWVISLDAEKTFIKDIRVVEMSCPHAFPAREASFLGQFKGKGVADIKTLKDNVHTIAKATGSSELTADAVVESIKAAVITKGKI